MSLTWGGENDKSSKNFGGISSFGSVCGSRLCRRDPKRERPGGQGKCGKAG